jgi:hypothetical protein
MEELIKSVEKLAAEELERANKKFPLFHSTHEGYAVILEEVQETQYELKWVNEILDGMWEDIKNNFPDNEIYPYLEAIKSHAIYLAAEAIQVAAMAQKFQDSFKGK